MKTLIVFVLVLLIDFALLQERIFPDYSTHPCKRECKENEKPMICKYNFVIELMFTNEPNCLNCLNGTYKDCNNPQCMPTDGSNRMVSVYNRMFPGPTIEVCLGDEILVKLTNSLGDTSTSIHWHGMHQRKTLYMDGVPHITQCPIQPFTSFEYKFKAEQAGTHFYHSHSALQKANGALGHLVIRQPKKSNLLLKKYIKYDYDLSDHIIGVTDWYYQQPNLYLLSYFRNKKPFSDTISSILINGFGPTKTNTVPPRRFFVKKNKSYRFRLIHAGSMICPIEVSIDGHKLIIVSTDGYDVEPITVDSFYFSNGERFDFVLRTNQKVSTYTMRFRGYLNCKTNSVASLVYEGSNNLDVKFTENPTNKNRLSVNCINIPSPQRNCIGYTQMKSLIPMEKKLKEPPTFKYFIKYSIVPFVDPLLRGVDEENLATPHLNYIKMDFPPSPLLQNPNITTCNAENKSNCDEKLKICTCVHLVKIPLDSVVELFFVDKKGLVREIHPIHLHGYGFRVVAQDTIGPNISQSIIEDMDKAGLVKRNLNKPPIKDVVSVSSGGYVAVRFYADNPGFWLLHCHIDFHMEEGMQMVIQTGEFESMSKFPQNFPKCGNYHFK